MAEKRTINIDINSNASEAEKDFKSFNKAVDETTKSAKNLDATFEEVYGDLQPLTTRMGEAEDRLYELALAGDTASKEYQELLTKVGEYRKVQIQTDLAVDGAATTMTQKLGSALNGATSGFAATQGAMALFGDENQALEESLLKVQSALAIQQGVQGLTEAYRELSIGTRLAAAGQAAFTFVTGAATTGMKLFRLALISTGIGAIVVGIGMLIANFSKVTGFIKKGINSFKKLGGVMKLLLLPITAAIAAFELVKKGLQALGVIESDEEKKAKARHKAKMERYLEESKALSKQSEDIRRASRARQKALDNEIEMLKAQGKKTRGLQRQKLEDNILLAKQEAEIAEKQAKLAEKNNTITASAFRTSYEARLRIIKEAERKLLVFDAETNTERTNNYKKYAKDRLSIARKIEDLENSLMEDGIEKDLEINRDKFRRLREDAEKNTNLTRKERAKLISLYDKQELEQQKVINQKYVDLEKEKNAKIDEEREKLNQERIDKEDALFQLELDLMKDRQTAEIIALAQSYEQKYLLAQDNAELTKQLEAQFLLDQAAIEDQFRQEKLEKDKEARDKEKEETQELQDAKMDIAVQGFQLIAGIAEAFAGEDEKRQKKAFQIKKVADIAAATVDGYRAVLSTYAQTPGGPVVKGIAAGIAGSFAALQIANIAKQQFQGGGDGADVAASADAGGGESVTPQFNVVGDSGINQIAQLQQQPVQAFVVSGEVTTSQALDRNRVQNATL